MRTLIGITVIELFRLHFRKIGPSWHTDDKENLKSVVAENKVFFPIKFCRQFVAYKEFPPSLLQAILQRIMRLIIALRKKSVQSKSDYFLNTVRPGVHDTLT